MKTYAKTLAELTVVKKTISVKDDEEFSDDLVEDLMFAMLNPWMNTESKYSIFTEDGINWICKHNVVAYDGLSANLYGYACNPKDALENCENLFTFLEARYYNLDKGGENNE